MQQRSYMPKFGGFDETVMRAILFERKLKLGPTTLPKKKRPTGAPKGRPDVISVPGRAWSIQRVARWAQGK